MAEIGFILHGKIRGKKKLLAELNFFFTDRHGFTIYETVRAMHATDLTIRAIEDGCEYLIAVGGDGTLNEVVNGFLSHGGKGKSNVVLGVLPWGTGNDFVRSIGMDKSVRQLAELIDDRCVKDIDAGQISILQSNGEYLNRYFDNIADLGIGADVVARVNGVHLRKKVLGGTLIFFLTALKTFMIYKHKKVKVSWPGFSWEGPLLSLVVANGRFFGSGLGIAPDALLDDGKFQVIIFGNLSVLDYLKKYGKLRRAERIDLPEIYYKESAQVSVFTALKDVSVEADGELSGKAPVSFKCLPAVLPFLIPPDH
ncbi:MAG: diacylglycerol kinase family lipid kinase [Bacteroidales bacterium]|nr:diacylglycerol kinase family lipid kinase [Bacteroidales bacterium]